MKDRKRLFKYFLAYVFTIFSAVFAVIIYLKYFPVESKVITEKKTVNETKLSETAIEDSIDKAYDSVVTVESYKNNQNIIIVKRKPFRFHLFSLVKFNNFITFFNFETYASTKKQ